MKQISIVTPTFNEEENIKLLYLQIKKIMDQLKNDYSYEHIVIDNYSTDKTRSILRLLSKNDKNLKCIFNTRNFGPVRSPYYGVLNASGDAVIMIASDFQDPPELIPKYIKKWEEGFDVVLAVKPSSDESFIMSGIRRFYYNLLSAVSDVPIEKNATGAGLYSKNVINSLIKLNDPYPYFRGLLCELGFRRATVEFDQPKRKAGNSKANISILFDQAFLAMTKHSKLPIRLMSLFGFLLSLINIAIAVVYFVVKLIYWESFDLGVAPLLIAVFFFFGVILFFLGILGEYINIILVHQRNIPLVTEEERINFD